MRRILPSVLFVLLYLLTTTLYAQTTCPPKGIEDCPDTGCGGWDRELNKKKNVTPGLAKLPPTPFTLEEIKQLKYPEQWFSGKDRAQLEKLGEGRIVQVTAYLVGVRNGEPTFANCKLGDLSALNDLLVLVSQDALGKKTIGKKWVQGEPTSVTAEITARVRLLHPKQDGVKAAKTNWTTRKLGVLISRTKTKALLVRITGQLLLDTEHIYNPLVRYTDWEIHPVVEIDVWCTSKENNCQKTEGWRSLDSLKIPEPPRPGHRGEKFQ